MIKCSFVHMRFLRYDGQIIGLEAQSVEPRDRQGREKVTHTHRDHCPSVQILRKTNHQPLRKHSHMSRVRQNQTAELIF